MLGPTFSVGNMDSTHGSRLDQSSSPRRGQEAGSGMWQTTSNSRLERLSERGPFRSRTDTNSEHIDLEHLTKPEAASENGQSFVYK